MRPRIHALHAAIGSILWAVCACLAGVSIVHSLVQLA